MNVLGIANLMATLFAQPLGVNVPYTETPPVIDGRVEEACWQDATKLTPFVDIQGDSQPAPRYGTDVRLLWDDTYFYVAGILQEPNVQASLTKHDSIVYHDNDFEIFIDPDGDGHNYYEIEINATNTIFDLFLQRPYRTRGPVLFTWDTPGLRSATAVQGTINDATDTDTSWSFEMAIPQSAVAFEFEKPMKEGAYWRVNFSRVQWRHPKRKGDKEDNWVWSPQGEIAMHKPERWGYVRFVKDAKQPFTYPEDELTQRMLYTSFEAVTKGKEPVEGVTLKRYDNSTFTLTCGQFSVNEQGQLLRKP